MFNFLFKKEKLPVHPKALITERPDDYYDEKNWMPMCCPKCKKGRNVSRYYRDLIDNDVTKCKDCGQEMIHGDFSGEVSYVREEDGRIMSTMEFIEADTKAHYITKSPVMFTTGDNSGIIEALEKAGIY